MIYLAGFTCKSSTVKSSCLISSNSRISPSQTVCDEDLDNLIDSEILKTSFPLDSVNAMSSMKGNTSTEVSPQKKHGKKWNYFSFYF
jgi:hypothetical protein